MKGFGRGLIVFLATGAYSGYFPFMPGTVGTVVGILFFIMFSLFSLPLYLLTTVAFIALAVWVSERAERIFAKKDASEIVIDEIAGFLVTMAVVPAGWKYVAAGFVLFRVFDIWKPYPANRINERMSGGAGVVLDDIVAGLYANLVLQVTRFI